MAAKNNVIADRTLYNSLSTLHGCLLYDNRAVIPRKLRPYVLKLLYKGHFGIQRINNKLDRIAVYWPNIDDDNLDRCRSFTACTEHHHQPSKPPIHSWMMSENHGVVYIWTIRLVSWVQNCWYWLMLNPNTLVFTLPSQFPQRVPLTYWSIIFIFRVPLCYRCWQYSVLYIQKI